MIRLLMGVWCWILFYIQSIILNSKGWCSWLSQSRKLERFGSETEIFIVRQEISLSTFLSLSISKLSRVLRVAGHTRMRVGVRLSGDVRPSSASCSDPRRYDLIP